MPIDPVPTDFVRGDATGLAVPAHGEVLRAGGEDFLTKAFHAFGSLPLGNRVARITRFETCPGGSTGHKLFLSVAYEQHDPRLHTDLFVKFSRDFNDPIRDRGRFEMEAEVRFAALSRLPGFPICVPAAYFADYHHESGTGMIITQRIAFGTGEIEPQHRKCVDHELADPLAYYRVVIKALARLAAAHKSGRLAPDIAARFPFDPGIAVAKDPIPYDEGQVHAVVTRYADFAAASPQLLPPEIRMPAFIARLDGEAARFVQHEAAIKRFLASNPDFIALCHWNAHIDNGWFWRDGAGELHCGLIDWGHVGQMNVAVALWGCLSAASFEIWDQHLEELLALFADELHEHGGPWLDVAALKLHLQLHVTMMGIAYLLDARARILFRLPEAAMAAGPYDPVFAKSETARNYLHILTVFLKLWRNHDVEASLDRVLAHTMVD